MKIYDRHIAPNPQHIFLAEKGIEVPLEEVSGDGFPPQCQGVT